MVHVYQSPTPSHVSPKSFQTVESVLSGMGHPPADLLGCELQLGSVGRQVIASSGNCSVGRRFAVVQPFVIFQLLSHSFDTRRGRGVESIAVQLEVSEELLGLARIRFILEALSSPSHDPVEDHCFFVISGRGPESVLLLELVLLPQLSDEPVEIFLAPDRRQIITMHGASEAFGPVQEHAG